MIEVKFTTYPRNGRKLFKNGIFRQKAMSIVEADNAVRKYATTLSKHKNAPIAFTITVDGDDEDIADDYNFDTVIEASDEASGIIDLIRRDSENQDLSDETQEDLDNLEEDIQDELNQEDEDSYSSDLEDDQDSEHATEDEPKEDSEELNTTSKMNQDSNAEVDEPVPVSLDNQEPTTFIVPANMGNNSNSSTPTSENSSAEVENTTTAVPPERAAEVQGHKLEITPSSEFENPDDIFDRLPAKYSVEKFGLNKIKHDLGFMDKPKDQFDRELNQVIEQALKEQGVTSIQGNYDSTLAGLENSTIDSLVNKYNEINQKTVDNEVATNTESIIEALTQKANRQKDNNNQNANTMTANEQERLESEKKAKLDEFKVQLENKLKEELRQYKLKRNDERTELNRKVDAHLDDAIKDVKTREKEKVINERNRALADERTKITNNFNQGVKDKYLKYYEQFASGLDSAILKIQEAQEEIKQKRELYQEKLEAKKRQEKANALKEREIAAKEKELALTQKEFESLPKEIAKAISKTQKAEHEAQEATKKAEKEELQPIQLPVIPNSGIENNSTLLKVLQDNAELKAQLTHLKNDIQSDQTEEKLDSTKKELASAKKSKKRWQIGIVSFLGGAALSSLLIFGFNNMHHIDQMIVIPQSTQNKKHADKDTQKDKNTTKSNSSNSSSSSTSDVPVKPKTKEDQETLTANKNLQKYKALATPAEKLDMLNGLLGQHDNRSLGMINQNEPTSMTKLYNDISLDNQPEIRKDWLNMPYQDRHSSSVYAKNTVALAFYNIHDWHNGWVARYAS